MSTVYKVTNKIEETTPENLALYYNLRRDICEKILKGMYYIYYHIDPRNFKLMYVGKGTKERAWDLTQRNKKHNAWIKELKELGLSPIIDVGNFFKSEDEAYLIEKEDLELFKSLGFELLNIAPGGMGCPSDFVKKPIICLTNNKAYSSTAEAANDLGILSKRINSVLKGTKKSYNGHMFRYVDESLNIEPDKERERKAFSKKYRKAKSVICNETGKVYLSIREAARDIGVDDTAIHAQLKGKLKRVKGLTFRRP